MAYKKIVRKNDGTIMLDLTQDTVKESFVKEGMTFHCANGESRVGTFTPQEKTVTKNGDIIPDEGKYLSKVIVNVVGGGGSGSGIVDVAKLPTENIDENAIYRIAEEKNNPPMAYLSHPNIGIMTLGQLFQLEAGGETPVIDHVIEVDELSEPLVPMISEGENGYIATVYVLKSTGAVYASDDGTLAATATVGTFLFGGPEGDKGYVDSVDNITEPGVYAVSGEVYYIYHYWKYGNGVWTEFVSMIEVSELPTENIQRNTCYILVSIENDTETRRYFVHEGQWVEYIVPKGDLVITENGTYDVANYASMTVDAVGELQEKTIVPTKAIQEVVADDGYDALSKVNVEAIPDNYAFVQGTLNVSANGNYDVTNYVDMNVNIGGRRQEIEAELLTKTITTYENNTVTTIGAYAFSECTSLTSVNLPAATKIESNAFNNCTSLTSVNLPVASAISYYAFARCRSLTEINLPAAKNILSNAFNNCTSLTSVNLPVAIGILSTAFAACYNLSTLILGNSSMCTLYNSSVFISTPFAGYSASFSGTPYIYVPASLVDAYKADAKWSYFASYISAIEDMPTA